MIAARAPIARWPSRCSVRTAHAAAEASRTKKWDVAADLGPTTKLAFDTSEGTWMNLDVSPDGKRIVFDLLGDIYIMPIDGSGAAPATRIAERRRRSTCSRGSAPTASASRSRQRPRRPVEHLDDGRWTGRTRSRSRASGAGSSTARPGRRTASTSTRAGTSSTERSLGAGEIWMYPLVGPSDGLQVTERNGSQKDTGEPDISPDGRYLYYSKDVTPGQTFEYNKDPNGTIYAIMRRDLHDRPRAPRGQRAGRIGHAAGVARRQDAGLHPARAAAELSLPARSRDRPRSPAVRQRRQGPAGGLGDPRPVSAVRVDARRQVDRHLGRREDLARRRRARQGAADPVHRAASSRRVNDAVRFPAEGPPDEFPVRMLRDVRVSPDGKHGRLQRARAALCHARCPTASRSG